jgi:pilus assembly protein Flp/PilA
MALSEFPLIFETPRPCYFRARRFSGAGIEIQMKTFCLRFWKDTQGQDLVEYALAAGMVAVAAVAAMPALSTTVSNVFTKIGSIINNTVN